jgi:hypothetical protein
LPLKHGANIGEVTLSGSDDFDWSPLGESFWRNAAEACSHKPTEQQIRFACLKHSGLNASDAATRSGYEGEEAAIRVAGHRASKSTAVTELLSYARAETGKGDDGIVSGSEARRILSRIARKGNNNERVKALEALAKLEPTREVGDPVKMAMADVLLTAVLLGCDDGQYRPELCP